MSKAKKGKKTKAGVAEEGKKSQGKKDREKPNTTTVLSDFDPFRYLRRADCQAAYQRRHVAEI